MRKRGRMQAPLAMAKLERMVSRQSNAKAMRARSSKESDPDTDALLEMVDKRVGQLLIKSSEIESKLDSMERNVRNIKAPASPVTNNSSGAKNNNISTPSTLNVKSNAQGIRSDTISPRNERTSPIHRKELPQNSQDSINLILQIVQDLQTEVRVMRREQDDIKTKLGLMLDALFREEEEEEEE